MEGLPVAYKPMAASGVVKPIGGEVYGWICLTSAAGTITVYDDNAGTSGNVLMGPVALVAGTSFNFSSIAVRTSKGIYIAIGGAATLNFLYN